MCIYHPDATNESFMCRRTRDPEAANVFVEIEQSIFLVQGAGIQGRDQSYHCFHTEELHYYPFHDDFGTLAFCTHTLLLMVYWGGLQAR